MENQRNEQEKYLPEKHKTCRRCGRTLKNPKYQEIGYGASCYKKILLEKIAKPLFEVNRDDKD